MLLAGVSVGVGAAAVLHDDAQVGRATVAALAQVPAAWVMVSVVVAVFGWAPRLTVGVWGLFVAFVALGEFGELWHAPSWVMDLSPFRHSPLLPVDAAGAMSLVVLTAVAAALGALGYAGWRRRDLAA
jgi:ABC-2 type transport system permease protein